MNRPVLYMFGLATLLGVGAALTYYYLIGSPSSIRIHRLIAKSKEMGHDTFSGDKAFDGLQSLSLPEFTKLYRAYMNEDEQAIKEWLNKQRTRSAIELKGDK